MDQDLKTDECKATIGKDINAQFLSDGDPFPFQSRTRHKPVADTPQVSLHTVYHRF